MTTPVIDENPYYQNYSSVGTPRDSYPRESFTITEIAGKKEIQGWYLYDLANGAFFYAAMNFLPLMITAQARFMAKRNYCGDCLENEWANAFETDGTCSDPSFESNSTCLDNGNTWDAELLKDAKYVDVLGLSIGYASIPLILTVISVVLQLLAFVTLGSFADFGSNRKTMFIISNSIGIGALFLVYFMADDSLYLVNGLLYVIAVVSFSFCVIFYNAYLPLLASARQNVIDKKNLGASPTEIAVVEKQNTDAMSATGLAVGFTGQLIFLILVMGIVLTVSSSEYLGSRIAITGAGFWMLFFTTITFSRLKTRPGPPLPTGQSYFTHGIHQAKRTFRSFKDLPELGKFLGSYFIFSDGTSTLAQAAPVFAQEELKMTLPEISFALIEVSICAVLGCIFFLWLHEKKGVPSKTILLINLSCMAIIPVYALLFLTQKWEFYAGIFVFGFNTGSQQAFTRSIFAQNLPYGKEAEYFSFYEVTDKGTAWLGPLTIALVFQSTGSYRNALGTLVLFFILGIALLYRYFDPKEAADQKRVFDAKTFKEIE